MMGIGTRDGCRRSMVGTGGRRACATVEEEK